MIEFETITAKNFLSIGNAGITLQLNKQPKTLVIGKNGSGKSSLLLDTLCFGLYGKAFRDVTKGNIVNSINGKGTEVVVEFTKDTKKYKIVRCIKPNKLEIWENGRLLDQEGNVLDTQDYLETSVLGMNFKSFTQIVVLGSATFTPFMQLSPADRRQVIEDILDIQIFSIMNIIAKEKYSTNKKFLETNSRDIQSAVDIISVIEKQFASIRADNTEKIEKTRQEIDLKQTLVDGYIAEIADLQKKKETLNSAIDVSSLRTKHQKLLGLQGQIKSKIAHFNEESSFLHDHDTCPVCNQSIALDFKEGRFELLKGETGKLYDGLEKINVDINRLIDEINYNEQTNKLIQDIVVKISQKNIQKANEERNIEYLKKTIFDLESKVNTTIDEKMLDDKRATKIQLEADRSKAIKEQAYLDVVLSMLRDGGIKAKVIENYLPVINQSINKYLQILDFFVDFNLDSTFKETIKSRHRDEYTFSNFSEGEKMRINMAILLAWRYIAKLRNSVSTNLLIMDEVFDSSMDQDGTAELFKLLEELSKSTNLFVISHNANYLDRFDEVIKVEKINGFTSIEFSN